MNLSFAGCGFLGIYHVGVAVCFKKYAPHLLLDKISGASAGALAACCLLCDLPLGNMTSDFFRVVNEARRHSLGPFSPSFNIQNCLMEGLQKHLPEDVHKRVNGRLHISLTRVYDGRNVIVSQYNNRDDVLQALLCACFIPGFSGILPPRFHGVRYMDGAFSDNLPILDENTVTVSPFCGESDICPRDQSSQLFHVNWANTSIEISKQNINRFGRILFPPRPEILSNMCQQGFDDALAFLHRNNLINCTRCVAVQSTFIVSETISDPMDFDPECQECTKHRKDALIGNMPDTVLSVIQTYIDSANKGLANWLFRHRGFKLLHALSLPATVPADFMFATISKIVSVAPTVSNHLCQLTKFLMNEINSIVKSRMQEETTLQANISCKIAYTECRGNDLQQQSQRFGSRQSVFSDVNINTSRLRDYFNHNHASDYDAFDHILEVTTHQDSVYAYYYMDDSNKVKVTEIFDMSDDIGYAINRFDERTGILQPSMQNENSWNVTIEDIYGDIPEDQYCNTIINAHDDLIIDEVESDWPHIEIEDISSDLSDPEVDQTHHISDNSSPYNSHRHLQNHPTTVIDKQMIQNV